MNCCEVRHVSSVFTDVLFDYHYDNDDDGDHDDICHDENGQDDNGQKDDNDLDMTIHHVFIPPPGQI